MNNPELMALQPAFERLDKKGILSQEERDFLIAEGILGRKNKEVG